MGWVGLGQTKWTHGQLWNEAIVDTDSSVAASGTAKIWRWGAQGVWGTEDPSGVGRPQRGPGAEPLVGGSGGIASQKLIAVI